MRLPFFDHIHYVKETGALERQRVELYSFDANRRYTVEHMLEAFPVVETEQQESKEREQENTAQFWTGFACADDRAEARRRKYAERAIEVACNIISEASDGSRHEARRRASNLLGGYIGGNQLSETVARAALESAVRCNTDSFQDAMKTIDSGLKHGQKQPITFEQKERERDEYLQRQPKSKKKKRIVIHLEPIRRPENTIELAPPSRPTNTIQLPQPTRPILTTEVAR
jgi:sugar diacid utilization regulator